MKSSRRATAAGRMRSRQSAMASVRRLWGSVCAQPETERERETEWERARETENEREREIERESARVRASDRPLMASVASVHWYMRSLASA
jgi:hypothetical protein